MKKKILWEGSETIPDQYRKLQQLRSELNVQLRPLLALQSNNNQTILVCFGLFLKNAFNAHQNTQIYLNWKRDLHIEYPDEGIHCIVRELKRGASLESIIKDVEEFGENSTLFYSHTTALGTKIINILNS